jgi:hypothetical protein
MQYHEHIPHDLLKDIAKCFWTLEMTYPEGSVQDVMPPIQPNPDHNAAHLKGHLT